MSQLGVQDDDPLRSPQSDRSRPAYDPFGRPTSDRARPETVPGYENPAASGAFSDPLAPSPQGSPAPKRYELAGWWSRVGAQLIDGIIICVVAGVLFTLFGLVGSAGFLASDEAGVIGVATSLLLGLVFVFVAVTLYAPLLMAKTNGKTLGRMATGIRVVRADGKPMDFSYSMLREVGVKSLLIGAVGTLTGGLGYLLNYLWPLWDNENRALHDMVVNTRTVIDD